jgi:membrane protein implicated in regulation of membrane protease activity
MIQDWQWMAVALIAVTFAGTMRSLFMVWASLAATAVGAIVWSDPSVPVLYQLLVFGAVTLGGFALSHLFIKPRPESHEQRAEEPVIKAPNPRHVINRTFTLTEPIVDGSGQIEIEGVTWRVRGEDATAGEQILVVGVDGLERDLLIVTKPE